MKSSSRPLRNVGEAAETRQKQARTRSLQAVNEQSEPVFNAGSATQVVSQRPASLSAAKTWVRSGNGIGASLLRRAVLRQLGRLRHGQLVVRDGDEPH